MKTRSRSLELWLAAFGRKMVWWQAAGIRLPMGCIQSLLNQGDVQWHHEATGLALVKSLLSPLVTFSVALVSAVTTWVEEQEQVEEESKGPASRLAAANRLKCCSTS